MKKQSSTMPRSAMPKGKVLIDAIRALPKEAFADALPPTTAKDWEDAELLIPLSRVPAGKKSSRRAKAGKTHESDPDAAKVKKAKRA